MTYGHVRSCWGEAPRAFHAPLLEWGHALRHQICRRTNIHHDFHNRICHLWQGAEFGHPCMHPESIFNSSRRRCGPMCDRVWSWHVWSGFKAFHGPLLLLGRLAGIQTHSRYFIWKADTWMIPSPNARLILNFACTTAKICFSPPTVTILGFFLNVCCLCSQLR